MSDKVVISAEDSNHIVGMAMLHRDRLTKELTETFPGGDRAVYAVAVAPAALFATSMTNDPHQQAGQARILNEILGGWPTLSIVLAPRSATQDHVLSHATTVAISARPARTAGQSSLVGID